MSEAPIFKIYLKKNIFLIFCGLMLSMLFFSLFSESTETSLMSFDTKLYKLEHAFAALEEGIQRIQENFGELKRKMNVIGTFEFRHLSRSNTNTDRPGKMTLVD